jgi:hypothetical protein
MSTIRRAVTLRAAMPKRIVLLNSTPITAVTHGRADDDFEAELVE